MVIPIGRLGCAAAVAAIALTGCSGQSLTRPHAPLTASAEPLRSDFNRDTDAVRLVVLASPT